MVRSSSSWGCENDPAAAEAEGQEEKIGNPKPTTLTRGPEPLFTTRSATFTWIEGKHAKCGSQDPITADTRILLLVQAYLPNLWHLFLSYAAPREGKEQCSTLSSHVSSEFPDAAKRNELMLCGPDDTGMGPLAHLPPLDTAETAGRVSLPLMVVHEASAIRCAKGWLHPRHPVGSSARHFAAPPAAAMPRRQPA